MNHFTEERRDIRRRISEIDEALNRTAHPTLRQQLWEDRAQAYAELEDLENRVTRSP